MGLPAIPNIPEDRLPFVAMRPRRDAAAPGVEDEMELYYTDTGKPVAPQDGDAPASPDRGKAEEPAAP